MNISVNRLKFILAFGGACASGLLVMAAKNAFGGSETGGVAILQYTYGQLVASFLSIGCLYSNESQDDRKKISFEIFLIIFFLALFFVLLKHGLFFSSVVLIFSFFLFLKDFNRLYGVKIFSTGGVSWFFLVFLFLILCFFSFRDGWTTRGIYFFIFIFSLFIVFCPILIFLQFPVFFRSFGLRVFYEKIIFLLSEVPVLASTYVVYILPKDFLDYSDYLGYRSWALVFSISAPFSAYFMSRLLLVSRTGTSWVNKLILFFVPLLIFLIGVVSSSWILLGVGCVVAILQAMTYSLSRMRLSSAYHFWSHVLFASVIAGYMIFVYSGEWHSLFKFVQIVFLLYVFVGTLVLRVKKVYD